MSLERKRKIYAEKSEAYAVWKAVVDAAGNNSLTPEQTEICDRCEATIDSCNERIAAEEADERRLQKLATIKDELDEAARVPVGGLQPPPGDSKPDNRSLSQKLRDAADEGMTRQQALDKIAKDASDQTKTRRKAWTRFLMGHQPTMEERAALQMDNDAGGGFLLAPEQFIARLIQDIDKAVMFRNYATVIPLMGAESMGAPALDTDVSDTNWTTELAIGYCRYLDGLWQTAAHASPVG